MRIVVICRPDLPVPPLSGYGGLQRNIYDFVQEIDKRGHQVYLFASLDSDITTLKNVQLFSNLKCATWANLVENIGFENRNESEITSQATKVRLLESEYVNFVIKQLGAIEFDAILVAYDNLNLIKLLRPYHSKTVFSIRDNLFPETKEFLKFHPALRATDMAGHLVEENPELKNISKVMWGINLSNYGYSESYLSLSIETPQIPLLKKWQSQRWDYLVMIAGIGEHKGQSTAIKIAEWAGAPLIIAGTPQDHVTLKKTNYFKNKIKPYLSDKIIYFGNANEVQKMELFRFAKGSLAISGFELPVFREPFGRSVVESLACGTPVIAYEYGSLPFLISHNISGFLFKDVKGAVASVERLGEICREEVRRWAEENLSIERVADEYLALFEKLNPLK